jgi:hypothetical protein
VAWDFHKSKRVGKCGFEALRKVLDVVEAHPCHTKR